MDEITEQLVDYAMDLRWDDVPADVVQALKRCVVDSVGCALGGIDAEPVTALRSFAAQRQLVDGCSVWGTDLRTTPELAALINATMIRFLDFNDHYVAAHPSDLLAAVFAAAESSEASPQDTLLGLLIAYEVHCGLARLPWRANGWDQGVFGVVATVCGAGRVLGLSRGQLADAIAIAVLNHVSLRQNRAGGLSMWKGVAMPYAAHCALLTVQLVREGITGPRRPFDGDDGVFQRLMPFELPALGGGATPFRVLDVDFKYWPVEFNGQLAVWAGREIRTRIALEDIARISVWTYHLGWDEIGREPEKWDPQTRETADHSLPYLLAIALQRGEVTLADFEPAEYLDARHRSVMDKIVVEPSDDITAAYPERMLMRVRVESVAGDSFDLDLEEPRGRARNPMSDAEVDEKFGALAAPILGEPAADALLRELRSFDESDDLSATLGKLRRHP